MTNPIEIQAIVNNTIDKVWESWTEPKHIMQWNQASPEWHCPSASNDLKVGGEYSARMEAKDGSFGFDLNATYTDVRTNHYLASTLEDDRKVRVSFKELENGVSIIQKFEAESQNPREMQQNGWQAILNSFKSYTENL